MAEARSLAAFGRRLSWLVPSCLALLVALNVAAIRFDLVANPQLANVHFQVAKLDRIEPVDTVFLGDSALGRLMHDPTWQALSGERSLHLALSGGEGYAGDLAMLQRLLERHRPRRVVLVHALDMPTRNIAWRAHLLTRPAHAPAEPMGWRRWLRDHMAVFANGDTLRASVLGLAYRAVGRPWPFFDTAYVRGRAPLVGQRFVPGDAPRLRVDDIVPTKRHFLVRVAELCAAEGLDCRYAFGPVWDEVCAGSADFVHAARAFVTAAGIEVVAGTPLCVPATDLDDTIDHVRPERMAHYTAELHARVAGDPARPPDGRPDGAPR